MATDAANLSQFPADRSEPERVAVQVAELGGKRTVFIPRRLSAAYRGPLMTRLGLSLIAAVAALGFVLALLQNQTNPWTMGFFIGEFAGAVLSLSFSWSNWFREKWDLIALGNAFVVIIGITLAGIALGTMAGGILGLLLLEVGSSAFLPWSPNRQHWLNGATIAGVAAYTLVWPRNDPVLGLYWLTTLAGAVIGEVACSTLYEYRTELERHIQTVVEGRRALAIEVRERARVIAELRRTQEELLRRTEEALAASRTKSDFLSTMSHEIRTPMNSVLGMAQLLEEAELKPEDRRSLQIIRQSGEMLLELINSILELARLESGRLPIVSAPFALRGAVESVLDAFTVAAREKSIELSAQFAAGLPDRVLGDSLRIRQVLTNLIGNSIKFTSRGKIAVTVEAPSDGESNLYRFSVVDTGIGIPHDKLGVIFEPFTQADSSNVREYGGSGLGLAIVARLVKEMGGQISVESEVGRGSTFVFTICLEPAPSDGEVATERAATNPSRDFGLNRHLRLLVADDVAVNRALIRAMLRNVSCEIEEVENGSSAVACFRASKYDAVLMDMQMPMQDGYAATVAIRDWERQHGLQRIPIIALTASAFDTDVIRATEAGCDAHLSKPIMREDLLKTLGGQLAVSAKAASSSK